MSISVKWEELYSLPHRGFVTIKVTDGKLLRIEEAHRIDAGHL